MVKSLKFYLKRFEYFEGKDWVTIVSMIFVDIVNIHKLVIIIFLVQFLSVVLKYFDSFDKSNRHHPYLVNDEICLSNIKAFQIYF